MIMLVIHSLALHLLLEMLLNGLFIDLQEFLRVLAVQHDGILLIEVVVWIVNPAHV
jgi:hypothetical protein